MDALRRRPFSAAALLASLVWIGLSIYEVGFGRYSSFDLGWFAHVQEVVQVSALGVLAAVALAFLAERIWPDARVSPRVRVPKPTRVSDSA
jgi:hypothetical protein